MQYTPNVSIPCYKLFECINAYTVGEGDKINILASDNDDKLLVFYLAIISGSNCGIMSVTTTVTG